MSDTRSRRTNAAGHTNHSTRSTWLKRSACVALTLTLLAHLPVPVLAPAWAGEVRELSARDTVTAQPTAANEAAQALLDQVSWTPERFTVRVELTDDANHYAVLTFPAPPVNEQANGATARMRWYAARDGEGEIIDGPAVLIVHSLHPRMAVANAIARGFAAQGVHAFVLEMPGFGAREVKDRPAALVALDHGAQLIAETRRARDAIAVLAPVRDRPIALQGTSLGGFVAAVAGAIDDEPAFDTVLLLLAGADAYGVLRNGARDAAHLRKVANQWGYDDAQLKRIVEGMDPRHVAHRLDPGRTWLFSAADDRVVPRRNRTLLAETIGLRDDHHVQLDGDHYTAMLALPNLIPRMAKLIHAAPVRPTDAAAEADDAMEGAASPHR